jgi:hypothetical protein
VACRSGPSRVRRQDRSAQGCLIESSEMSTAAGVVWRGIRGGMTRSPVGCAQAEGGLSGGRREGPRVLPWQN